MKGYMVYYNNFYDDQIKNPLEKWQFHHVYLYTEYADHEASQHLAGEA